MAAARAIGATAIEYPKPAEESGNGLPADGVAHGIRVGIIARAAEEEAWISRGPASPRIAGAS